MQSQDLPSAATSVGTDTCLMGYLETWPMSEIVLWMHQTRRTGMLRVGAGFGAGVLFFRAGELYRCEWGQLSGEQGLLALLEVQRGAFSLIQREPPYALANITRPTSQLLLQIAVSGDEHVRAGQA